jgi:hypothetical protein
MGVCCSRVRLSKGLSVDLSVDLSVARRVCCIEEGPVVAAIALRGVGLVESITDNPARISLARRALTLGPTLEAVAVAARAVDVAPDVTADVDAMTGPRRAASCASRVRRIALKRRRIEEMSLPSDSESSSSESSVSPKWGGVTVEVRALVEGIAGSVSGSSSRDGPWLRPRSPVSTWLMGECSRLDKMPPT